jgi:hypothetical protein
MFLAVCELFIPLILQVAWVLATFYDSAHLGSHPNELLQAVLNVVSNSVVAPVTVLAICLATFELAAYQQLELFWVPSVK